MAHKDVAELQEEPYWWEAPPTPLPGPMEQDFPRQVDIAIVGSGVTGLHAAIRSARGGRQVVVIEAGQLGSGASTRNNGMVVPYLRKSPGALRRELGEERARLISRSAIEAFAFLVEFIRAEKLDCDLNYNDRYLLARTKRQLEHLHGLIHEYEESGVPTGFQARSPGELEDATGLVGYVGAVHTRSLYALHPGRYVAGLIRLAQAAGVLFAPYTCALAMQPMGGEFAIRTSRGEIRARKVAVATNGYSFDLLPWLQRRIIPVTAYMAASAPIAPTLMTRLFPVPRSFTTADRNLTWIRSSPDRTRILFGGRTGYSDGSLARKAHRMLADAAKVLPELRGKAVSHCWKGNMAFTFDGLPHTGEIQGIHYAAGYCGAGLAMGSWLGYRLGCRLLGEPEPRIALEEIEFPSRVYYRGKAWFVPLVIRGMNIRDNTDRILGE